MKEASTILFDDLFNGKPLFRSQLDLVTQLLNDPDNPYFIDISNSTQYSKALSRLKTYVSQLLSDSATRSITEDFKRGLIQLLQKKLGQYSLEAEPIVVSLINSLKLKNSKNTKSEIKNSLRDQLNSDLTQASYIAVITSKPLEIGIQNEPVFFSLRNFLFKDLLDRLSDVNKDLKFYRFNFPMETYCFLFWRGLKRILAKYLTININPDLIESLYGKFTLKTATHSKIVAKGSYTEDEINEITDEILQRLNNNRYIMVFHNQTPIYGMPLIALNPTDPQNIRVYSLLQNEKEDINIYKYSEQDCTLWRVFVWDNLKSKKFAGNEIVYTADI